MKRYESIIIINPNQDDQGVKAIIDKFSDLINKIGKLKSVEEMGKRRLAYEIQKHREGIYILFNFDAQPDSIAELERNYRITDEIIKFIVVRKDV